MAATAGQRGITLLEACIVVAIVAIITSSAAPSMQNLVDSRRLGGAASQLASDIQFIRSEAVARNQPLRLSIHSVADTSCYVIHSGAAAQCTCRPSGPAECSGGAQQIKTVVWPAGDKVALQANVASLLFDPLHGTSTPTGTLRVSGSRGRSVHHVVNIMGRVRSCTPEGALPGYRSC